MNYVSRLVASNEADPRCVAFVSEIFDEEQIKDWIKANNGRIYDIYLNEPNLESWRNLGSEIIRKCGSNDLDFCAFLSGELPVETILSVTLKYHNYMELGVMNLRISHDKHPVITGAKVNNSWLIVLGSSSNAVISKDFLEAVDGYLLHFQVELMFFWYNRNPNLEFANQGHIDDKNLSTIFLSSEIWIIARDENQGYTLGVSERSRVSREVASLLG